MECSLSRIRDSLVMIDDDAVCVGSGFGVQVANGKSTMCFWKKAMTGVIAGGVVLVVVIDGDVVVDVGDAGYGCRKMIDGDWM